MKCLPPALLAMLLATLPMAGWADEPAAAASAVALSPEQHVDGLFAKWNKPGMPGCVVAVIRDGRVLFRKGYGMADIERGAPMSPATVLNVGSMSKQFTAFAIHLLAQEGKLSLDDDVRKHLPDVPNFGKTITIRHLLQHTSGLRDEINLMILGGWRIDDVITQDDVLSIIQRQRVLNFSPGQEHLYSNTGYTLLAAVVQRVAGKPLAAFAKERIFDPLGMKHTFFQQDYGTLVPGRALSYQPAHHGIYKYIAVGASTAGPGGLMTTVEDLALWDRNFYDARVGGTELIAQIQATGVLNSGKPINYASGLFVETYRGTKLVEHSGGIGGYRAQLSRFPEQRFSVAVLANSADINPSIMARRIADIYLDRELGPKSAPAVKPATTTSAAAEIALDPARLDALVGYYALSPEFGFMFTKEGGRLMAQATGQEKFPVFASGEREFFYKVVDAQLTFDAPDKDGIVAGVVLHQNGQDQPGVRSEKPAPSESELKEFVGEFYSDELHVLYTVFRKDGKLMLTYPRGTVELDFKGKGAFAAEFPIIEIKYQCLQGGCNGFTVTNGRVRDLQFTKVAIVAPGSRATATMGVFLK
ncbi:serine hydrolase [Massilia cavernae]|uniref:Serine hydrolase n=1 Tax=Massilia cavernae TaxID=2320864 RepID=A0A418X7E0_9BURK|nr:serine hydrolase [Massilia cavernae]RJG08425.1 serine hydrolase [Massilia cavernae]